MNKTQQQEVVVHCIINYLSIMSNKRKLSSRSDQNSSKRRVNNVEMSGRKKWGKYSSGSSVSLFYFWTTDDREANKGLQTRWLLAMFYFPQEHYYTVSMMHWYTTHLVPLLFVDCFITLKFILQHLIFIVAFFFSLQKLTFPFFKNQIDEEAVTAMFEEIADKDDPLIANMEGICTLCEHLEIDPMTDVRILVLLHKMGPLSKPAQISKDEWIKGCKTLRVDSLDKMKALLPSLELGFMERSEFRDFFKVSLSSVLALRFCGGRWSEKLVETMIYSCCDAYTFVFVSVLLQIQPGRNTQNIGQRSRHGIDRHDCPWTSPTRSYWFI